MNNNRPHYNLLVSLLLPLLSCTVVYMVSTAAATSDNDVAYPIVSDNCLLSGEDVPIRKEVYDNGQIFDISHRYIPDMPSFGVEDGLSEFLWLGTSMKYGSLVNVSMMKFSVHSGTHVDAPSHMFDHYSDAGFDVDVHLTFKC